MSYTQNVVQTFNANVSDVIKFVHFDREVLKAVALQLEDLHERLKRQKIDNEHLNAARELNFVKTIRENDSLKLRYGTVQNQAVVLLVSYFASALSDVFRLAIAQKFLTEASESQLMKEDIRISFAELREQDWTLKEAAPNLLIAKEKFSFQDMGSSHRAFRDYLNIEMDRDAVVNNIIVAEACRHVIVHDGGKVNDRLLKQIRSASPRTLKRDIKDFKQVQFLVDEVEAISNDMRQYVTKLAQRVDSELSRKDVTPS